MQPHGRAGLPERRHADPPRQARWPSSAPATRPWTPCACACDWAPRRSTASTAAPGPRRRPGSRRSSTPRRRASSSTGSPRRWRSSTTARATSAPCGASRWSWASRTIRAAGARCPMPGTEFEFPMRPGRVRHRHQRQPDHRPDVEARAQQAGATSRSTRTWPRPWPACTPAATSSPARPPSSRPWAPADWRPRASKSTSACARSARRTTRARTRSSASDVGEHDFVRLRVA